MYRISPFTYIVSAVLSTGLAKAKVICADIEILHLSPPTGQTCSQFLKSYVNSAGGYLLNPNSVSDCQYCSLSTTDQFLETVGIRYSDRWQNVGILCAFIAFNAIAAIFMYWLLRVPKKNTLKGKH